MKQGSSFKFKAWNYSDVGLLVWNFTACNQPAMSRMSDTNRQIDRQTVRQTDRSFDLVYCMQNIWCYRIEKHLTKDDTSNWLPPALIGRWTSIHFSWPVLLWSRLQSAAKPTDMGACSTVHCFQTSARPWTLGLNESHSNMNMITRLFLYAFCTNRWTIFIFHILVTFCTLVQLSLTPNLLAPDWYWAVDH